MASIPIADPLPPLVVAEGWDITFFSSETALNWHLEPWFPSKVEYRAYDSEGRKLELSVDREKIPRRWFRDTTRERIMVRAVENEPGHVGELADFLTEWLPMIGAPKPPPNTPLAELLRVALEHGDLDP